QRRSASLGPAQPQFLFQGIIAIGHFGERPALLVREWPNVVIETGDQDPPISITHAVEQMSEQDDGIRSPVTIVAAVKTAIGAIHGQLEASGAARAEIDLHAMALMDRAVTQDPCIGPQ